MKEPKLFLILAFIVFGLVSAAPAQIVSVSQLRDVKSTDNYYPALKNLIENYNAFNNYPDNTFRAEQPLTRVDFAKILFFSLDKMLRFAQKTDTNAVQSSITKWVHGGEDAKFKMSAIKDISPSDKNYAVIRALTEDWFIDLSNQGYFRPNDPISEKDFYQCLFTTLKGDTTAHVFKNYSPVKNISRGNGIVEMSKFLDELRDERVPEMKNSESVAPRNIISTPPKNNSAQQPLSTAPNLSSKLDIIRNLPSKGRARITNYLKFYLPDSSCPDLSGANREIKTAFAEGGIWGDYKIKKGDEGDIVFETTNTCRKGKILLMRVGTAIVTMTEDGIKRLN